MKAEKYGMANLLVLRDTNPNFHGRREARVYGHPRALVRRRPVPEV